MILFNQPQLRFLELFEKKYKNRRKKILTIFCQTRMTQNISKMSRKIAKKNRLKDYQNKNIRKFQTDVKTLWTSKTLKFKKIWNPYNICPIVNWHLENLEIQKINIENFEEILHNFQISSENFVFFRKIRFFPTISIFFRRNRFFFWKFRFFPKNSIFSDNFDFL